MNKEKGITLIALIITVIVLLILAGAAITIGLNENDIFAKANTAKVEWNKSIEQEELDIKEALSYIGTKIPNDLNIGDTVNWTPSGHYTWDYNYYCEAAHENLSTKMLYSGEEVPSDAEYSTLNVTSDNMDLTISSWKVLKIDKDNNTVVLVPSVPTRAKIMLGGAQGYNNGVKLLNDACSSLYGNYMGVKAKSINLEYILSLIPEEKRQELISKNIESSFGMKNTEPYTTNKMYPAIFEEEQPDSINPSTGYSGKILKSGDSRDSLIEISNSKKTAGASLDPIFTNIALRLSDMVDYLDDYSDLIFSGIQSENQDTRYWIANRSTLLKDDVCVYAVNLISGYGTQIYLPTFKSDGSAMMYEASLFPIVELTSGTIKEGEGGTYTYEPFK